MRRFWKNRKGSISLFLLIILTAIFFFNAVLIDYARLLAAHLAAERALTSASRSILAHYDRELQEKYGLYGVNIVTDAEIEDKMDDIIEKNITMPEGASNDFLNMQLIGTEVSQETDEKLTLADRNVFTMQVLEDMKFKGPIEFSLAMLTPLSEMSSKLKSHSSESKALDEMDKDNLLIQKTIDDLKQSLDKIQDEYDSTSLAPQFIAYAVQKGFRMDYLTKLPIAPIVAYVLMYLRAQIMLDFLKLAEEAETGDLTRVSDDPQLEESIRTHLAMFNIAKRWIEDAVVSHSTINSEIRKWTRSNSDLDKAIAASERIDSHNTGGDPYNTRGSEGVYDNVSNEADRQRNNNAKQVIGDKLKGGLFGSCSACGVMVEEAQKKLNEMKERKRREMEDRGGVSQVTSDLKAIRSALKDAGAAASNLKTRADEWRGPIVDASKPIYVGDEGHEPFAYLTAEALQQAKSELERQIGMLLQASNPGDFKVENAPAHTFDAQKLKDYVSFAQLVASATAFQSSFGTAKDTLDKLKRESDEARAERAQIMGMFNSVSNCFDDLFNLGQFAQKTATYQTYKSLYDSKLKPYHDKFAAAESSVSLEEIDMKNPSPTAVAKDGGNILDEKMTSLADNLGADDNILINEYALLRFKIGDLAKTDPVSYKLMFDEEVEYILQGSHTPGDNYKAAMGYIYLMRLGLNYAYMMVDKQYAPIRAIPFGIGYIILLVLAIFDSFMDLACLKKGERVPLWKGFEELGWTYKDYLRFFLNTQGNKEEKINRMQAILQTRDDRYNLYEKYVRINASAEMSVRLWFLPQAMRFVSYTGELSGSIEGNRYTFEKSMQLSY